MSKLSLNAAAGVVLALGALNVAGAEVRKEARLDIAPGGSINIVDNAGSVAIRGGSGRQVVVISIAHSAKVEVDQNTTPDKRRVEIITHAVSDQKPTPDEARVDYDITVPAGISVTVVTATAPVTAEGLSGDVSLSSETGQITLRSADKVHIQVRGVTAPVSLSAIANSHVEVTSSGGTVQLVDVSGPNVHVGTTSGNIAYRGDCSGGGDYSFTTHSGSIDVILPESASFDLSARSVSGAVQNDFPLQEKSHASFVPKSGSSFAGTSHSGSSSVELQSFSGRIRVKKQ